MNSERPRKVYKVTDAEQEMLNFTERSLNLICRKIGKAPDVNAQAHSEPNIEVHC